MRPSFIERTVADLPPADQVRMATIALAGWRIVCAHPQLSRWTAWRPDGSLGYGAATLLGLLDSIPEHEL